MTMKFRLALGLAAICLTGCPNPYRGGGGDDDDAADDDDGTDDDDAADDDDGTDDDDAADDDDGTDDDDATPEAPCFDTTLTCPSGLPTWGAAGTIAVESGELQYDYDPESGWSCSEPLYLQIASGTSGVELMIGGQPFLLDSIGPGNSVTFDPFVPGAPATDEELLTLFLESQTFDPPYAIQGDGNFRLQWPTTPTSLPPTGCSAMRFGFPGDVETATTPWGAVVNRVAQPARLDIHAVLSAGAQISEAEVMDVLGFALLYYSELGVQLGDLTFEYIGGGFDQVEIEYDLASLLAEGTGSPTSSTALQVYFVRNIIDEGVIGYSGGIPGALTTTGLAASGVVVETLWVDGDDESTALLALDVAHEAGHFLGLRHTTEIDGSSGWTHDLLTDTVECENGGADDAISPDECATAADYVMFPILEDPYNNYFTSQQAAIVSSTLPGPAVTCTDHSVCGSEEVCAPDGRCSFAYVRPYTLYLDSVDVPDDWDAVLNVEPDPYASWFHHGASGQTATIDNQYFAEWYESATVWVYAQSPFQVDVYDEDGAFDDLIDAYSSAIPIAVEDLRSPYLDWYGASSTLSIGFEPQ